MNSGGINEKKTHKNGNKSQTIENFFMFFFLYFSFIKPLNFWKKKCNCNLNSRPGDAENGTTTKENTLGLRSDPCCIKVPMVNQKLLASEKSLLLANTGCSLLKKTSWLSCCCCCCCCSCRIWLMPPMLPVRWCWQWWHLLPNPLPFTLSCHS